MCISFLWGVQDHVDIIEHDERKKDDENENEIIIKYDKILNDIYSYRELSKEQMDEVYTPFNISNADPQRVGIFECY